MHRSWAERYPRGSERRALACHTRGASGTSHADPFGGIQVPNPETCLVCLAVQYPGVPYIAFYMQYRGGLNFSWRHFSRQSWRSLAALTRFVRSAVSTPLPLPRCAHSLHLQYRLGPLCARLRSLRSTVHVEGHVRSPSLACFRTHGPNGGGRSGFLLLRAMVG